VLRTYLGLKAPIADLEGVEPLQAHHMAEALQYRTRVLDL